MDIKIKTPELIWKFWLPVFLWAGLIFRLSSIPVLESGLAAAADLALRKSAHLAEFGILSVLLCRAVEAGGLARKKAWFLAVLWALAFAASDEIHQLFVPGREGRLLDVFFDALGILIGAGIYDFLKNRKKSRPG